MALAITTVDLARLQFATTSLYHFLFVPLTLGLAPLIAVMQTLWYRGGNEAWLRLTRFFGTLMLINFAIGVATGLVQEFQFGMNWSIYSEFVGDVFGAPLAIEGLAAFMLESTFLGLWIFGWDRLSKRVHLATVWLFAIGSWASAFFIISANSWMQRPVGSTVTDGRAELTDVWELFSNRFGIWAYIHVLLVGLTTAAVVIFGVACWHLVRGRNQELFRHAAKLALIVGVPISALNLGVGSQMGVIVTDYQPMKIASTEAQWDTCQPCAFSLFQIGGFTEDDQTPSFSIQVPHLLSILATLSWDGEVVGMNELQASDEAEYGAGDYIPPTRTTYWSMRIMAYAGTLVFLVLALGAFLYWRGRLASTRWFLWLGVATIPLPYAAALAGWVLSEVGRQPWIVWGLLKTVDANSPSVSTATIATSLGTFVVLYVALLIVDVVLMRRYARVDPPEVGGEGDEFARSDGDLLMDLETFWFCLIVVVWAMYFLLEGFDFGVGMLLPFVPRSDEERSTALRTIGPVWDGNEVWLVVAGGATFAAFPAWYATMFSGFYLALLLILVCLIVRVCSFEWRSKSESPGWRSTWTWANTIGSFGASLLWGIGLSCLVYGTPIDSDGDFTGNLLDLFSPYSVFAGIAVVALFAFHGATFLTLRTVGDLRARSEAAARKLAIPAAVLGAAYLVWTVVVAMDRNDKDLFPPALPAALGIAALGLAVVFVFAGRTGRAFAMTALGTISLVATLFVSLYPRVMVSSTDFANSLTVDSAASSHYALQVMSVVALISVPVVLLYQGWSYYVFRHRVGDEREVTG